MLRETVILIVIVLFSGCSVLKKAGRNDISTDLGNAIGQKDPGNFNLSNSDFNILKAEVEFESGGDKKSFFIFLKYRINGNYLVSARSKTGIEAARLFIKRDSVFINDRINRVFYLGSSKYLSSKYGIPARAIPVIFGDLVSDQNIVEKIRDCPDRIMNIVGNIEDQKIEYTVDCKIYKAIKARLLNNYGEEEFNVEYKKFKNIDGKIMPLNIFVRDVRNGNSLKIDIIKVDFENKEPLSFVPGNNYEKIVLK